MPDNLTYQNAMRVIAGRRQRAVTGAQQLRAQIDEALPSLRTLEIEKSRLGINAATLAANGASHDEIDAALAQSAKISAQCTALLLENGFAANALEPLWICPVCKDTGHRNGAVCNCVKELMMELRRESIDSTSLLSFCSFDKFDVSRYPDTFDRERGISARAHMQAIFDYCKAYATNFTPSAGSLYMSGYAGLGKTHLALSIASTVLALGYEVLYVSAQGAFAQIEREHFSFELRESTLESLCNAQMLVLDDLGTEHLSPYVSACIYDVINTRMNRKLPTIYTSNIADDATLVRRYTEKIASRLLGSCEPLSFFGWDLRLTEK